MAKMFATLVVLLLHAYSVQCMVSSGRAGHGLVGYGIDMYNPNCAYSCRAVVSSSTLSCSTMKKMKGMDLSTPPDCFATDDTFLQTLAYCISTRCGGQYEVYELEKWWVHNVAGRKQVQPSPKISYQQSLAQITKTPTMILVSGDPLNTTSLVRDVDYIPVFNAQEIFELQEVQYETYGLVVFLSGFVIPIGFSLLRFIPFPAFLSTKFNSLFITPPLWGKHHAQPVLFNLVQVPTRGQAFFIAYFIILNFVLSAVNISSLQPNSWYPDGKHDELLTYVSNRVGVLSFANLPLIFLYAGRNNVLLWLTNWSHSTFLLLHRWIAYISTLQACLHSAVWLQNYIATDSYTSESVLQYWYWGIIATLAMSIMLPTAIIPIRQKMYEVFLLWHIALSVLVVAGCYLHIYYRFDNQWGYELWILITIAIWGFDRVMRVLRFARNGVCTAQITPIDDDYIRIDIKGVASPAGHAYLYFPTLTWRVWENHPFSAVSSVLLASEDSASLKKTSESDVEGQRPRISGDASSSNQDLDIKEMNSSSNQVSTNSRSGHLRPPPSLGLTFFMRTRSGLTSQFQGLRSVPVLVESTYGKHEDLAGYPSLICIAGGVGITAVLTYLQGHPGSKKLYWGVRKAGIVKAMDSSLEGIDKEVFIEERMVLKDVLEEALGNASPDGAAVLVSGPASMADEVRVLVSEIGMRGGRGNIKLVEESFTW